MLHMERELFGFSRTMEFLAAGFPVARQAWVDAVDQNEWDLVGLIPFTPTRRSVAAAPGAAPVVMMLLRNGSLRGPLESMSLEDLAATDWYALEAS